MSTRNVTHVNCDLCDDSEQAHDSGSTDGCLLPHGWRKARIQKYDCGKPTRVEDVHLCPVCVKVIKEKP